MKMNAATDSSIIETGKQCAIFDRCVFEHVTVEEMKKLNQKYAFVFPEVLLMECANAERCRVIEHIEKIEDFLIISIHNGPMILKDFIPSPPHEIMKKDLGVSTFRKVEEDSNLVYFLPYDKKERMDLINWAKGSAADEYYKYFNNLDQRFQVKHTVELEDVVERTVIYGFRHGERYIPKDQVRNDVKELIKAHRKKHGYNPFYGKQLEDVIGLVKKTLQETSIIEIINNLSTAYSFDASWPKKQIAIRPNYPYPDDYAKYCYYFYFINMCSAYCGFMKEKTYLRDWEYLYYLPFCPVISADKRFFKNLKKAMKNIGTDKNLGMNISDRIHIWGEDNI